MTTTSDLAVSAPDHRDRYELSTPAPWTSIDELVGDLVLRQPSWLTALSMGIGSRDRRRDALDAWRRGRCRSIGNWTVVEQSDTSIVFAEDMRIMRYRLTYALRSDGTTTASTDVQFAPGRLGRAYWAMARRGHRRFLPRLLANAGGAGSSVRELEPLPFGSMTDRR